MNKRVAVVVLVATVLAAGAILAPWWVISMGTFCGGVSLTLEFHLFGMARGVLGTCAPNEAYQVIYEDNATGYVGAPAMQAVFLGGAVLTVAGTVCGVGMVALSAIEDRKPRLRGSGLMFGAMATVLAFAAPLLVTALLPGAINQDSGFTSPFAGFWGTAPYPGGASSTLAWGAGMGWYLVLAAAFLFLVGSVVLYRDLGRPTKPASPPDPSSS